MAKFTPTAEQIMTVELMVAAGIPHESIGRCMGFGVKQLQRAFGKSLKTAKDRANAKVVGSLFKSAMKGNVTACIFWLKVQAGWLEAEHQQAKERDEAIGQEIARVAMHGLKRLDAGEMAEFKRLLTKVGCMDIAPAANDQESPALKAVS